MGTLSNLKCASFIYDRKKSDFGEPLHTMRLKGREENELSFFAKGENDKNGYPAASSQSESPFLLPDHQATRIMLPPDQMLK